MSLYFEDRKVGETAALGAHTFSRESIIAFAVLYDPQPHHMSEEGGKASIYGALTASGWHIAGVGMRLLIDWRSRLHAERVALGEVLPKPGVSPGFRDLRWPAPVRAGDTVSYAMRVESMRETKRPQWGLITARHTGLNQHGAEVFGYTSAVLWERRPG
jgi:acyl dehydratase